MAVINRAPWPPECGNSRTGGGCGLVGLVARSRSGNRVVFSDYDPVAVQVCRHNAVRNQHRSEVLTLDWRNPPSRQFAAIVGCEVTYDPKLHEALLDTLGVMLAPQEVCWLGDPGRYWSKQFFTQASHRFRVRILDRELRVSSFPRTADGNWRQNYEKSHST